MFDPALRRAKDAALRPLVRLVGERVHPTVLTVAGFAVGLVGVELLVRGYLAGALALWWLNRVIDGLDGAVARAQRRQSDLGGYLDLMMDFTLYALVPLAAAASAGGTPAQYGGAAVLLATFYVNAASWLVLSAIIEKRAAGAPPDTPTSIVMPSGLVEGTETIVLFSLYILFPTWLVVLFAVSALLVALTAAQRVVWAIRSL